MPKPKEAPDQELVAEIEPAATEITEITTLLADSISPTLASCRVTMPFIGDFIIFFAICTRAD